MEVTDIKLRRLTGNGTSTARDEENLRDDLLRVLITYLSQDGAHIDPIIELEVHYTLDNDEPGLFIFTKGRSPMKVLDQRLDKRTSVAWGSREVGVTDGGLYDVGPSHTVIRDLRERPGAGVLVLLSPFPGYLNMEGGQEPSLGQLQAVRLQPGHLPRAPGKGKHTIPPAILLLS